MCSNTKIMSCYIQNMLSLHLDVRQEVVQVIVQHYV